MTQIAKVKNKKRKLKRPIKVGRKPLRRKSLPKQPKRSLFRRIFGLIFNPVTFSLFAVFALFVFLTASYFWMEFSDKIDLLLAGEVFTRSSGVYSAPKTLKRGERISVEELTDYLKSAGYVKKEQKANATRSRYSVDANTFEIEPGTTGMIDGKKKFRSIIVKFNKKGKTIASIIDKESEEKLGKTALEPKLLNSIASEGDGRRKVVTFEDLPQNLVKAITVTEDRAFFEHYGVNFRGIARALWRRYEGETGSPIDKQGGSSITQQLVKNLLLSPERSYERKAKEAYMSIILETRLSKKEIFTLYANQIYLGQNSGVSIYGVGEAANIYFGKDVSALTLSESAFIAGIIRSPNRYNPYKNLERVEKRRNQIIDSMLEANAISLKEAEEAREAELTLHEKVPQKASEGMQYFSQYAIEQLPKVISNRDSVQHLRVYTTIDPDLQKLAHKVVTKRLARLEKYYKKSKRGKLNAALVAIRPKTGEIVAMIGGKNFEDNQFNRASDAQRQPGSVFKPFVYATAINSAYDSFSSPYTTVSIFKDEKKEFTFNKETYSPNNYGDFFSNKDVTLRDALIKSKNTITVDLAMRLNVGKVMNLAHKAGLPKVKRAFPSMALGTSEATPLQMAGAYTTFANLGDRVLPMAINRVTSGDGRTIAEPKVNKRNVLRSDVAYIMNDMMKDVINKGTAYELKAWGFKNIDGKRGFAGKTGTSRDGWFAGFTPELVCVVYVGFDDGSDLNLKGSESAMPIWADFMRAALREHPEWNGDWRMPPTIRRAEIDIRNGGLIRELTDAEADSIKTQKKVIEKDKKTETKTENENKTIPLKDVYISNIPAEFRRIELFLSGTMPKKMILPTGDVDAKTVEETKKAPISTPTPFTTWEDAEKNQTETSKKQSLVEKITLMICPTTNLRARSICTGMESKSFVKGKEPKRFCTFHTK